MKNIYYKVWVDCILVIKSKEQNKLDWKFKSMTAMNLAMTFNFLFVMIPLQKNFFNTFFYQIEIGFLPEFFNFILTVFILYLTPCIVVNNFFIFRGNRYQRLLKSYPYYKGALFTTYFVISIMLPSFIVLIGVLIY